MVREKTKRIKSETIPTGRQLILRNPTTIKTFAKQIVIASDDYIGMRMAEKEYQELIFYYARYHGSKFFSYETQGKLNPTIENRISKKRVQLVEC